MPEKLPGKGLLGWLGRQFGYVRHAVKQDPAAPPATPVAEKPKVVYRDGRVEEAPHPTDPNLKLRRTVIDEVIQDKKQKS